MRDSALLSARNTYSAVRYTCSYTTKAFAEMGSVLQGVGTSLADLDKRHVELETAEGKKISELVKRRQRLQRCVLQPSQSCFGGVCKTLGDGRAQISEKLASSLPQIEPAGGGGAKR